MRPFAGGPAGLLAELTHRCPLQCPYCSNPLELERANVELSAAEWGETFRSAAAIGALQLHLSGGEPTLRRDLEEILQHAVDAGLYTNLVTSAVMLTRERLETLAEIGLDHVQVSIQDVDPATADRVSAYEGGVAKKRDVALWTRELGLGLTINAPIHRQNIDHLPEIIDFAVEVGAQRLEVAHIQYYAWAEKNRAALIPTREKFLESASVIDAAKARLKGVLNFDFVIHDHYATRPKTCTGGWGRSIIAVTPSGKALPCHAAQTLPGLAFDNVRDARSRRHLAQWFRLQRFSRHGLDEGALSLLRSARDRPWRLPLSGHGGDRRPRRDRSRLPSVAGACSLRRTGRGRGARAAASLHLSAHRRRRNTGIRAGEPVTVARSALFDEIDRAGAGDRLPSANVVTKYLHHLFTKVARSVAAGRAIALASANNARPRSLPNFSLAGNQQETSFAHSNSVSRIPYPIMDAAPVAVRIGVSSNEVA